MLVVGRKYFFEIFRRMVLYMGITTGRDRGGCRQGPLFYMPNADVVEVYEAHAPVPVSRQVIPLPSGKRILFSWADSINIRNAHYLPGSTVLH